MSNEIQRQDAQEMSIDELDAVAGGAASVVDADNLNVVDTQASATIIGAKGGITSLTQQTTAVSQQSLKEVKFTGNDLPGIGGFFND